MAPEMVDGVATENQIQILANKKGFVVGAKVRTLKRSTHTVIHGRRRTKVSVAIKKGTDATIDGVSPDGVCTVKLIADVEGYEKEVVLAFKDSDLAVVDKPAESGVADIAPDGLSFLNAKGGETIEIVS